MAGVQLHDRRRTRRAVQAESSLAENPLGSLPAQLQTWKETKALYRLLDEPDVTFAALMQLPETRLSSDGGTTVEARSSAGLSNGKHIAKAERDGTMKLWSIRVRSLAYMPLGSALYGGLSQFSTSSQLSGSPSFLNTFPLLPVIVIPLFFEAIFGPWVGLFTGGVGYLIRHYIFGLPVQWNSALGLSMLGFVAGLAMLITRGRYNNVRSILIAEIFSATGVIVGIGIGAYGDIWFSKVTVIVASDIFISSALSDLVLGLILLPILLVIHNVIVERIRQSLGAKESNSGD